MSALCVTLGLGLHLLSWSTILIFNFHRFCLGLVISNWFTLVGLYGISPSYPLTVGMRVVFRHLALSLFYQYDQWFALLHTVGSWFLVPRCQHSLFWKSEVMAKYVYMYADEEPRYKGHLGTGIHCCGEVSAVMG
jgi:hypothetical protein